MSELAFGEFMHTGEISQNTNGLRRTVPRKTTVQAGAGVSPFDLDTKSWQKALAEALRHAASIPFES